MQLHRQLEDVLRHLQVEGLPVVVVAVVQTAWKRKLVVPVCKGVGVECTVLGMQLGLRTESGAACFSFLFLAFH